MFAFLLARLFGKASEAATTAPAPSAPCTLPTMSQTSLHAYYANMVTEARDSRSIEQLTEYLGYHNGYVREAALDRAVELGTPAPLLEVAKRLNDWVAPVRDKARNAVLAMLARLDPETDAEVAMTLLLQVDYLKHARRSDHAAWIARFEQVFIDVMGVQRIMTAIGSRREHLALRCFVLARTHQLAAPATLCQMALAQRGNALLHRHAMDLARSLPESDQLALYQQALRSRVGIVRAEALRALLRIDTNAPAQLAMSMLADRNTWVRLIAGNFLSRRGVDVPQTYAELINAAGTNWRTLRACLAGLADSGGAAHLDLIRVFSTHAQARVQEAAFMAWIHLSPKEKDAIALLVLHSAHRRVRKLFTLFTSRGGGYVPIETAMALMRKHGDHDQMLQLAQHRS